MKPTSLVLRCCRSDLSSKNNFIWPDVGGTATAPDWVDNAECGHGLHGWLFGQGDHSTSDYTTDENAKWLVVEVRSDTIRMLGGKCKFPSGKVVFIGTMSEAAAYLIAHEPQATQVAVIGHTSAVGDKETTLVGALGTATAGESGTATAGYRGTATAGYRGTATAGESGEIRIRYYDSAADRYRTKSGYVGEDGIEADTAYRLNDAFDFIKA